MYKRRCLGRKYFLPKFMKAFILIVIALILIKVLNSVNNKITNIVLNKGKNNIFSKQSLILCLLPYISIILCFKYSLKIVILSIVLFELITFSYDVITYSYIELKNNNLYKNNKEIIPDKIFIYLSHSINPVYFINNKGPLSISSIGVNIKYKNKRYEQYIPTFNNGFNFINELNLHKKYNITYIYKNTSSSNIYKIVERLTLDIKNELSQLSKRMENLPNEKCISYEELSELYRNELINYCNQLNFSEEEITTIKNILL